MNVFIKSHHTSLLKTFTNMDKSNDGLLTRHEIKLGLLKIHCPVSDGNDCCVGLLRI